MNFEPISLDRQQDYLRMLRETPQIGSDFGFVNIWGWGQAYGLTWAWEDGLVWLKQSSPYEAFWAPMGNWNNVDWEKVFAEKLAPMRKFIRVPEMLANIWAQCGTFEAEEENIKHHWDYVYDAQKLRDLSGNNLHKKKNLVNQFDKNYDYQYIEPDGQWKQRVLNMQEKWCAWRECDGDHLLQRENEAIHRVLDAWDNLETAMGAALLVDGEIVAYTIGEALTDEMVIIRFEKGDVEYKGVYQAINRKFLQNTATSFTLVNREEDLGDAGLRKAKLSYHPEAMIKKYNVTLRQSDWVKSTK